jgi:hypothetical protein
VNMVMSLRIPTNPGNFVTSRATVASQEGLLFVDLVILYRWYCEQAHAKATIHAVRRPRSETQVRCLSQRAVGLCHCAERALVLVRVILQAICAANGRLHETLS